MKKLYRLFGSLITLSIVMLQICGVALANEGTSINSLLVEAACNVHRGESGDAVTDNAKIVRYTVYDLNSIDITDQFLADTKLMYITNNTDKLRDYCEKNVGKIVETTESIVQITRSDIGKTVDEYTVDILRKEDDVYCTVAYTVRGAITYDPNTYQISYASRPMIVDRIITGPSYCTMVTENEYGISRIASNKLSATFEYEFYVLGVSDDYEDQDFGKTSCSFVITPD